MSKLTCRKSGAASWFVGQSQAGAAPTLLLNFSLLLSLLLCVSSGLAAKYGIIATYTDDSCGSVCTATVYYLKDAGCVFGTQVTCADGKMTMEQCTDLSCKNCTESWSMPTSCLPGGPSASYRYYCDDVMPSVGAALTETYTTDSQACATPFLAQVFARDKCCFGTLATCSSNSATISRYATSDLTCQGQNSTSQVRLGCYQSVNAVCS